jgi:purine-binding chemotaxis protein CheW
MDLVEIRKKAKNKKKKLAPEKAPEPAVEQQEQGADQEPALEEPRVEPELDVTTEKVEAVAEEPPVANEAAAPEEDEPIAEPVPDASSEAEVKAEDDPIDALFAYKLEDGLITTENYLQALVASDEEVDSNIEQWLTFSVGNEEYALSIESVSEIIKPREVTDIPRVPDFISGIISLRGIIVPVFDLTRRLNLGESEMTSASRIIVCQDGERLAGFIVDRINQVVNVPISNIEPPPTVLSGLDRDFVEGVGRVDDRMLILLHLSHVINAELV